jgi:DHA1 family inner membrane transport protein
MMTSVAHFALSAIAWLLIVFGLGLVVGNPLGARAADRHLMTTIAALLSMLIGVLLLFDQIAHAKIPAVLTLFALGAVGFAAVPAFTSRVLTTAGGGTSNVLASSAPRSPPSTSATQQARFSGPGHCRGQRLRFAEPRRSRDGEQRPAPRSVDHCHRATPDEGMN